MLIETLKVIKTHIFFMLQIYSLKRMKVLHNF